MLSPQHQTVLSLEMAQVCWSPAAMRLVKSVVETVIVAVTVELFERTRARHAKEKTSHNELCRLSWRARSPRNVLQIMESI
jgi:hypothetical protein